MCPAWNRVAEEIEALASDRLIAARGEPDEAERTLLAREAWLLQMAADAALTRPADAWMVHSACEGVVVHCDVFVMWGITREAEDHLRTLAMRAADEVQGVGDAHGVRGEAGKVPDPLEVLRAVLGMPFDHVGGHVPHPQAPMPAPTIMPAPHAA